MSETGLKGSIEAYVHGLREVATHIHRRARFFRMVYERVMTPRVLPNPVRSVLFVCAGNVCRSPLAEVYFREKARKEGQSITVDSAGVEALLGKPAHRLAKEIARQHGISLEGHATKPLYQELIQQSDLILVMEVAQRDRVRKLYPQDRHKVFVLGQFCSRGSFGISDPHLGTREDFQTCFERIRESCDRVMHQLDGKRLSHMVPAGPELKSKEQDE